MKAWISISFVLGIAIVAVIGNNLYRRIGAEAEQLQLNGEQALRGLQVAREQGCVACHTLDGSRGIGPTWLGMYGRTETLSDGATVTVDDAYILESIVEPSARIVRGYENLMVRYPLPREDLDALLEFTRQLGRPPQQQQ